MHREISHTDEAFHQESNLSLYLLTGLLGLLIGLDLWPGSSGGPAGRLPTWPNEFDGYRIALLAAVLGGARILYSSFEGLFEGRIGADLALAIACIAAILIDEPLVAAEVVFIGMLGECLESFTFERTQRAIRRIVEVCPRRCWLLRDGQEVRVFTSELQVGDRRGRQAGRPRAGRRRGARGPLGRGMQRPDRREPAGGQGAGRRGAGRLAQPVRGPDHRGPAGGRADRRRPGHRADRAGPEGQGAAGAHGRPAGALLPAGRPGTGRRHVPGRRAAQPGRPRPAAKRQPGRGGAAEPLSDPVGAGRGLSVCPDPGDAGRRHRGPGPAGGHRRPDQGRLGAGTAGRGHRLRLRQDRHADRGPAGTGRRRRPRRRVRRRACSAPRPRRSSAASICWPGSSCARQPPAV